MPIRTADPAVAPCVVHKRHSPKPLLTVFHHVVPESWTRYLGLSEGLVIPVCGTGHDNIHTALRRLVIHGQRPRFMGWTEYRLVYDAYWFWQRHPELHSKAKVLLRHP